MPKPDLSNGIWGSSGASIDPGGAKTLLGWIAEIPPHETQNWWQERADEMLFHINGEGIPEWDANTDYPLDGWAKGSDGEVYVSNTTPNQGNDPTAEPEWDSLTSLISVPDATTSVKGKAALATNAEVQAGIVTDKIVTPSGLASKVASTTAQGIVELATNGETQTGTDATRAVTPAGLESKTATETRKGIAELATQAETDAGTDDERIVTPLKLKDHLDGTDSTVKAFLSYDVTNDVVNASFGIDSVTKNGTGSFTVNFTAGVFSTGDYSVGACVGEGGSSGASRMVNFRRNVTPTSSACRLQVKDDGGGDVNETLVTATFVGGQ